MPAQLTLQFQVQSKLQVALNQHYGDTTSHWDLCVMVILQLLFKREFNLSERCHYGMI